MITSALKMETVRFSEALASTSQSTRRPNPEEHHQYCHRRENLISFCFNLCIKSVKNVFTDALDIVISSA
jgi:hypothetical protein